MDKYTWKDIVKIKGKIYAEEHTISGEKDEEDIYCIDDFFEAVAKKHKVEIDEIETYMMGGIDFDHNLLSYGAEMCGCYINGVAEWLII